MVPKEPQRTHMNCDHLSNMFSALGANLVVRKVELHQRAWMVKAVLAHGQEPGTRRIYIQGRTYWHLGTNAATMIAPETPSFRLPKVASLIEVSMAIGSLSSLSPRKVNFVNAELAATQRCPQRVSAPSVNSMQEIV